MRTFFLVMHLGMTTSVAVIFSQRRDYARAVYLHVDNTAREIGLSSSMTASSCSADNESDCPELFVLGIFLFYA